MPLPCAACRVSARRGCRRRARRSLPKRSSRRCRRRGRPATATTCLAARGWRVAAVRARYSAPAFRGTLPQVAQGPASRVTWCSRRLKDSVDPTIALQPRRRLRDARVARCFRRAFVGCKRLLGASTENTSSGSGSTAGTWATAARKRVREPRRARTSRYFSVRSADIFYANADETSWLMETPSRRANSRARSCREFGSRRLKALMTVLQENAGTSMASQPLSRIVPTRQNRAY